MRNIFFKLFILALFLLFCRCNEETPYNREIVIDSFHGFVGVQPGGDSNWYFAETAMTLSLSDTVRLLEGSYCDLLIPEWGMIRMEGESELRLYPGPEFYFEEGVFTMSVDSARGEHSNFSISTAQTEASLSQVRAVYKVNGEMTRVSLLDGEMTVQRFMELDRVSLAPAEEFIHKRIATNISGGQSWLAEAWKTEWMRWELDWRLKDWDLIPYSEADSNQISNLSIALKYEIDDSIKLMMRDFKETIDNNGELPAMEAAFSNMSDNFIDERLRARRNVSGKRSGIVALAEEKQQTVNAIFNGDIPLSEDGGEPGTFLISYVPYDFEKHDWIGVTGTMNNWNRNATGYRMNRREDGNYYLSLSLSPGAYQYKINLSGSLISNMSETADRILPGPVCYPDDGNGGKNALFIIK